MKQIRQTYKKTGRLHHAYGLFGERAEIKGDLHDFLQNELKFPTANNSDFWQKEFNVFKIDDSRAVYEAHLNRPVKYERKVFVILANSITRGAQNSLLKILEEPKAETVFFLILPEGIELLGTLQSRLVISKSGASETKLNSAEEFLEAKVGKRLQIVTKITKDIKDEKLNKSDAVCFIKNLEKVIKHNWKVQKGDKGRGANLLAVEDLEKAISYANDESPSIKVILEHLALVL